MPQKKKLFTGYTIYLVVLLAGILLYFAVAYPAINTSLTKLDAEYNLLHMQNQMLAPYETKMDELQQQTDEANAAFAADDRLLLPAAFSNLISDAADAAEVTLDSVYIEAAGETPVVNGYTAQLHTARVIVGVQSGAAGAAFLEKLESYKGAGLYVTSLSYLPGETVKTLAAQAGKAPAQSEAATEKTEAEPQTKAAKPNVTDQEAVSQLQVDIRYYTVAK